jgi:hypothetical protein
MPIVVPPFVQYQSPIIPLRGLWNSVPPEGDRFASCEINWGVTTGPGMAVQFQFSGNSPVALSQLVAFNVDNTSNAADVSFLFPDSGYTLVVPAYSAGVFPVFTNALMFYAVSPSAVAGDKTLFQALNSMPPPITVTRSEEQAILATTGISLSANANTQLIPATVTGTLEAAQMVSILPGNATMQTAACGLIDGNGKFLWEATIANSVNAQTLVVNVIDVHLGFVNGLRFSVALTSLVAGSAVTVNLYYVVP